jgi:hypothetical protein
MDERLLDKLRKLVAHEESARKIDSIAEAEAFAAKIQLLLFEHKLSMSDVQAKEVNKTASLISEDGFVVDRLGGYGNFPKRWPYFVQLATGIAKAHFCGCMISQWAKRIYFVGREEDRQVAIEMFRYLAILGIELGSKSWRVYDGYDERWAFLKSFYLGYVVAICSRYTRQAQSILDSDCRAIVLVRTSQDEIQDYMRERTVKSKRGHHLSNSSLDGYYSGRKAGDSVALTSKTLSGS